MEGGGGRLTSLLHASKEEGKLSKKSGLVRHKKHIYLWNFFLEMGSKNHKIWQLNKGGRERTRKHVFRSGETGSIIYLSPFFKKKKLERLLLLLPNIKFVSGKSDFLSPSLSACASAIKLIKRAAIKTVQISRNNNNNKGCAQ